MVLSPGYIFTQIARRLIAHVAEPTDIRFLLTIITAGILIQACWFPWTIRILGYFLDGAMRRHAWEEFAWAVIVGFLTPLFLGVGIGHLLRWSRVDMVLDRIGLGYVDRIPSAWDYVILQKKAGYVRVHLKDGKGMVGGVFAKDSLASTDSVRSDLYLERAWQLDEDGNFVQEIPRSRGVWVAHDVMAYVYFLEGEDTPDVAEHEPASEASTGQPEDRARHGQAWRPAVGRSEAVPAPSRAADCQEGPLTEPTDDAAVI